MTAARGQPAAATSTPGGPTGVRVVHNQGVDVLKLLEAAALLVPGEHATGNDVTADDVWEYLRADEWDTALQLLEELGDAGPLPPGFWESLATAAEQMGLERSAAWCRWRWYETRNGVIRADLTLRPASEARRQIAFDGAGVLRPMWDIGDRAPNGAPDLAVARLWVESAPSLAPGGRSPVRLAPLTPRRWRHLQPGELITMHEDRSVAGTAVILESRPPETPPAP